MGGEEGGKGMHEKERMDGAQAVLVASWSDNGIEESSSLPA